MKGLEYKVIRFLLFVSLLFLNYHFLIFLTSLIAPEGFLDDIKRIGGFFINLLGLHALFAFGTFIYSRIYMENKVKFYLLGLSIITPLVYLLFSFEYLYELEFSDFLVVATSFFVFNFFIKDFRYNYIRQYFNVLIDPFYYNDDIEPF